VALRFPPAHPFNPLAALRLCVAAGATAQAVDAIFDWIWQQGRSGDSSDALAAVAIALGIDAGAAQAEDAKARLRANTEAAIAAGVYGVPTLEFDGQLFWGNDAHEFALAALRNPGLLAEPEMRRVSALPVGIQRR
jgi:2-hydroxychromene-2-carboxylate isomerase